MLMLQSMMTTQRWINVKDILYKLYFFVMHTSIKLAEAYSVFYIILYLHKIK